MSNFRFAWKAVTRSSDLNDAGVPIAALQVACSELLKFDIRSALTSLSN
jgi:hypothetical protein